MSDRTALGDRMKAYEQVWKQQLPGNSYVIIRVDGNAFHSYLAHCDKPFDYQFIQDMDEVAKELCEKIQGSVFAFTQSDEISVLLTDFETPAKQQAHGGSRDKLLSLSAARATAKLNTLRDGTAMFDSRVFTLPSAVEVANYFRWRQDDATRNSISMAAQAYFSPRELHGKNGGEMQEMLFSQHGVNWNDYPDGAKRGRVVYKATREHRTLTRVWLSENRNNPTVAPPEHAYIVQQRSYWAVDGAPRFVAEPGNWLADNIPAMPVF